MEGKRIIYKGKTIDKEQVYFLNDDAYANIPYVNDLMDMISEVESFKEDSENKGLWTKEQIINISNNIDKFGMFDKIIERLNESYADLNSDEFKIDKQFIEEYYASLSDRRQIASAGMLLGNRLSKIPQQLIQRRIMKQDEDGKRIDSRKRNWNISYLKKLGEVYEDYKKKFSDDYFEKNVTIVPDTPILGKFQIIEKDKEKYDEFLAWFNEEKGRLGTNRNFYFILKDFYVYSKLKYCESYFYRMKDENIAELIRMQERGEQGIHVYEASRFDREKKADGDIDNNIGLLRVDVAGNSMPYVLHYNKDSIRKILDKEKDEKIDIPEALEKGGWGRFFSHTITKEQEEFIKKHSKDILRSKDLLPKTRVLVQYLSNSIQEREKYEIKKEYMKRSEEKKGGDKMEETSTKKRTVRKGATRQASDIKFIENSIPKIEEILGFKLDTTYIEKLKENKTTMRLEGVYAKIYDELKSKKTKEKGTRLTKDEANKLEEQSLKIFVYSKLTGNRYSGLIKKEQREKAVTALNDNLDEQFEKLREGMEKGVEVESLKETTGQKKTEENDKTNKLKSSNERKEDTEINEDNNLSQSTVYKDKPNAEGKNLKDLIKKRYINRIEQKQEEIKAKKAEIDMLWAQLQKSEAELRKLQLEEEELKLNKDIEELDK